MEQLATAAELARLLDTTRQQISTWYARRDRNGFPEPIKATVLNGYKYVERQWRVQEVLDWRASYVPDRGGRPPLPRDDFKVNA